MLDQRRRCWAGVVQMLYNCFVFTGKCQEISTAIIQRQATACITQIPKIVDMNDIKNVVFGVLMCNDCGVKYDHTEMYVGLHC